MLNRKYEIVREVNDDMDVYTLNDCLSRCGATLFTRDADLLKFANQSELKTEAELVHERDLCRKKKDQIYTIERFIRNDQVRFQVLKGEADCLEGVNAGFVSVAANQNSDDTLQVLTDLFSMFILNEMYKRESWTVYLPSSRLTFCGFRTFAEAEKVAKRMSQKFC